jgi:hypothetical protein
VESLYYTEKRRGWAVLWGCAVPGCFLSQSEKAPDPGQGGLGKGRARRTCLRLVHATLISHIWCLGASPGYDRALARAVSSVGQSSDTLATSVLPVLFAMRERFYTGFHQSYVPVCEADSTVAVLSRSHQAISIAWCSTFGRLPLWRSLRPFFGCQITLYIY